VAFGGSAARTPWTLRQSSRVIDAADLSAPSSSLSARKMTSYPVLVLPLRPDRSGADPYRAISSLSVSRGRGGSGAGTKALTASKARSNDGSSPRPSYRARLRRLLSTRARPIQPTTPPPLAAALLDGDPVRGQRRAGRRLDGRVLVRPGKLALVDLARVDRLGPLPLVRRRREPVDRVPFEPVQVREHGGEQLGSLGFATHRQLG
jgi:hypothetical protein